ncbi:hypothetical protein HN51_018360, partial [Arachis hypogaea]
MLCIYCEKLIRGGGINRVKYHLDGKGGDIEACRKVPAAVRHQINQKIEDLRTKKKKTQEEYVESYNSCDEVEREVDEIKLTPGAQQTTKSVLQSKKIVEKCDIAIARWMMDASVLFNATMIDTIANIGAGYKGPNYGRICGYLLSKLVEDVKKMIEDYREIWKQIGCIIMVDGWIDRCRHTLINFLVYCPKRIAFLKSVDASHVLKIADILFKLLKDVVLFVGPENVVHEVTDNAANYVAIGRLLESEFPRLSWSPYAVHF